LGFKLLIFASDDIVTVVYALSGISGFKDRTFKVSPTDLMKSMLLPSAQLGVPGFGPQGMTAFVPSVCSAVNMFVFITLSTWV